MIVDIRIKITQNSKVIKHVSQLIRRNEIMDNKQTKSSESINNCQKMSKMCISHTYVCILSTKDIE